MVPQEDDVSGNMVISFAKLTLNCQTKNNTSMEFQIHLGVSQNVLSKRTFLDAQMTSVGNKLILKFTSL